IDDDSIRQYGQWPWPRTDIARLTLALGQAGASAIAFDIVFAEEDRTSPTQLAKRFESTDPQAAKIIASLPDNDDQLATVLGATPSVMGFFLTNEPIQQQARPKAGFAVLGTPPASVAHYSNAVLPLPGLIEPAAGIGSISIERDADAVIRRAPLIAYQGDQLLPALSTEALRVAFATESVLVKTSDGSGEVGAPGDVVSLRIGDIEAPTDGSGEMWMHYTRPVPERIVPAWKLLSGEMTEAEKERYFAGQIVFIGTSAIGLRDLRATPVNDRELGVMVHAQAAEQMILERFLSRPDWALGLERVLLLIVGLTLVLLLPRLGAAWGALFGGAAVALIIGGSWYAFTEQRYLLNPTWPAIGIVLGYLLTTVATFYREERQRAYIHNAFDRYLAPELVARIADDPAQLELGGEEREMTVLFCDVRSFSSISEKLSPDEIIRFLIAFLTPMTNLLLDYRSTIDKYIGDAILAFWNAPLEDPDQHENAARAALAMIDRLVELNETMPLQDKEPWPGEVKIGIGLNAGRCCVGNMGSEQRLSYSLIGDTVNLASRIEGLTKYYGVQIAMGETLHEALPQFATVELDRVRVVGREAPEAVFALLGDETLAADTSFQSFADQHAEMLSEYRSRNWEAAEKIRSPLAKISQNYGLIRLYELYSERIMLFKANDPGVEWDGTYSSTEK
ncbi:MAG: adenylate/guanylate cyclase domain-containing protein, partial [Novosphingobium sp.]|nr:adenylate/guanylate cyclase domain-containing protein [Novosphingobium sp.]